ncbi:uncharacterized protein LOC117172136 [Belonocnema kinseyi]|uniref:uncharacterized protein LOC117172136 n=1 Tax=Belonocnema kinseyi TaxID=2817044 RepID=UPI00143D3520|nr:uncharacterized protein LOC117172136 [Belonocnema kinseyi]
MRATIATFIITSAVFLNYIELSLSSPSKPAPFPRLRRPLSPIHEEPESPPRPGWASVAFYPDIEDVPGIFIPRGERIIHNNAVIGVNYKGQIIPYTRDEKIIILHKRYNQVEVIEGHKWKNLADQYRRSQSGNRLTETDEVLRQLMARHGPIIAQAYHNSRSDSNVLANQNSRVNNRSNLNHPDTPRPNWRQRILREPLFERKNRV